MRIFDHFNQAGGHVCPICGENTDKPTVLIPIAGTGNGSVYEAVQTHAECLQDGLRIYKNEGDQSFIVAVAKYYHGEKTDFTRGD